MGLCPSGVAAPGALFCSSLGHKGGLGQCRTPLCSDATRFILLDNPVQQGQNSPSSKTGLNTKIGALATLLFFFIYFLKGCPVSKGSKGLPSLHQLYFDHVSKPCCRSHEGAVQTLGRRWSLPERRCSRGSVPASSLGLDATGRG